MTTRTRVGAVVLAAVFLAGTGAGCGGGDDDEVPGRLVASIPAPRDGRQAPGTYVAITDAARAPYLALVAQGDEVLAFICDGDVVGEPLGGRISGSRFDLSENGVRVSGTVQNGVVAGEVTLPGGGPTPFVAHPATEGRSGLYRAVDGDDVVTWWIQTEEGIKGTRVSRSGKRGFATSNPAGFEGANIGEAPPVEPR